MDGCVEAETCVLLGAQVSVKAILNAEELLSFGEGFGVDRRDGIFGVLEGFRGEFKLVDGLGKREGRGKSRREEKVRGG